MALALPVCAPALERVDLRLLGPENAGLSASLTANSVLKSLEARKDATPDEIVAAARADYARMVEAAYAAGHYAVVVSIRIDGQEAAQIDPFRSPARIDAVTITVEPGRPFHFGAARIGPLAAGTAAAQGFRSGAPAGATVVRDAAQSAVENWRAAGHAKAQVASQSVLARHDRALLDVDLRLAPGPRVTFGEAVVSGQTHVKTSRVRKIAGIPEGQVFTPEAVDKAAARLRKTGTFKSVQVSEAETVAPDGSMGIDIAVIDRKPRRFGAGVEFSSFDGLTLSGYWLHRNIFGGAERLRIDAEVGQIGTDAKNAKGMDYSLSARLEKPAVYGPDTLFFAEAGLAYLDEPDFIEETVGLTLGVSREFSDRLSAELGLGYSFSRVTDLYVLPKTTRELRLVSLPAAITFDGRDDRLDTTSGLYLRGEVTPFYETGASQSGGHLRFDGRAYRAMGDGPRRAVLAGRLQLGTLVGPDAPSAPPDFLFYSGGAGTVRGQPLKSLGADYGGVTLGGRSFAALSAEARFAVGPRWGLVAFADAGYVGDNFGDGDWHAGAGLGVRYKTPVGPIRVDIAGPVAGTTGSGVQLYIGIGQSF